MAKGSAPRVVLIRENLWEAEHSGEGGVIGGTHALEGGYGICPLLPLTSQASREWLLSAKAPTTIATLPTSSRTRQ